MPGTISPEQNAERKSNVIEKILHYVWLGPDEIPDGSAALIRGWERLHPGWQIKKWDESNFDCRGNAWVEAAMTRKNFSLAADIIRSYALLNEGGVYLDTDVELIKPLDTLAEDYDFFIGFETGLWFGCAVLGARRGHPIMREVFLRYLSPCGKVDAHTNMLCVLNFSASIKRLYPSVALNGRTQKIGENAAIFAADWFFPKHYITRNTTITGNTVAIHHYTSTWWPVGKRVGRRIAKTIRLILGESFFSLFERIARFRMLGRLNREYHRRCKGASANGA